MCPCACNSGGFCGGCGHAGCGGRSRAAQRDRYGYDTYPANQVQRTTFAPWRRADDED